jgi:hypothetical protein
VTTAWKDGAFSVGGGGVVSRSNVVLGRPDSAAARLLPLVNGSLGVAAWAASGFTAQLNRSDTQPDRLSPGQVQVSFNPNVDGSFRVVVASPRWTGGNTASTASGLAGSDAAAAESSLQSSQSSWWKSFWADSVSALATTGSSSASTPVVSLRAHENGKYAAAEDGGS